MVCVKEEISRQLAALLCSAKRGRLFGGTRFRVVARLLRKSNLFRSANQIDTGMCKSPREGTFTASFYEKNPCD